MPAKMPNFRLSSQHLITTTSHLSKIHKGDLRIDESFPDSSIGKESACNAGDPSSISGSERSAGEGIGYSLQYSWASWVAQLVKKKNLPTIRETCVQSLGWEDPLEKERLPTPVF